MTTTDKKTPAPKGPSKLKIATDALVQVEDAMSQLMETQRGLGSIVANWEFSRVRAAGKDPGQAVVTLAFAAVRKALVDLNG